MFDPNLPQAGTEIDAVQMRSQLNGLKDLIDAISNITSAQVDSTTTLNPSAPASVGLSVIGNMLHFTFGIPAGQTGPQGEVSNADLANAISNALSGTSNNTNGVGSLGQIADPNYNQTQMQAMMDKLDELIQALRR